mgnify:CR=1 FL=1
MKTLLWMRFIFHEQFLETETPSAKLKAQLLFEMLLVAQTCTQEALNKMIVDCKPGENCSPRSCHCDGPENAD